jgi:predicted MPP superfamily phosphohydrolase
VGLDDPMTGWSLAPQGDPDPDRLDFSRVQGPPPRKGDFSILLNHRPEGYRQASLAGFNLYLAGHTHGGQLQLPGVPGLNAAALFYKYTTGLYHEHPAYLNVSRGLGSVGLPFRLFAWRELDVLTLRRG